ncbi:hypothetical protein [Sphingomonas alpina]|uniref:Uncharacterized protein n=1 Tax=Sphingomonas alpina TaxID=653931 RepID=A0A7H0LGA0_9SPHN|nr:hypothetical protein [Sphingomonas alpina]QNQ08703.1 hypothetical protein H3Z74_18455 [Sphingomonas alpina]
MKVDQHALRIRLARAAARRDDLGTDAADRDFPDIDRVKCAQPHHAVRIDPVVMGACSGDIGADRRAGLQHIAHEQPPRLVRGKGRIGCGKGRHGDIARLFRRWRILPMSECRSE